MNSAFCETVQLHELLRQNTHCCNKLEQFCTGIHSGELDQKTVEEALRTSEQLTLALRRLHEEHGSNSLKSWNKPSLPALDFTGYVEMVGYQWLHICVKTLLPSASYQVPEWFSDTIRRLLDDYERSGNLLPYFKQALLVIEEHSDISGRKVFDQDNKGWKAVSNALKGRLIPDDDQYSLGLSLLSTRSNENTCHITLLDSADAADYFMFRRDNCWF